MMTEQTGVAVVGGGVVGCFIAYRLTLEGIPATLVECEYVGAGASGASAGDIQPWELPSSNGFLLSAVLAHILTELLVHHRQHPFLPRILPERLLQSVTPR
jgi:2-polyprenyl-6-methoxyphenol hydroxylase-like FAD-dependent oxidoreductase